MEARLDCSTPTRPRVMASRGHESLRLWGAQWELQTYSIFTDRSRTSLDMRIEEISPGLRGVRSRKGLALW